MHKLESVLENEMHNSLLDFTIQQITQLNQEDRNDF